VHGLGEELGVDVAGIEVTADPLHPLGVLLVVRVGDRIEELVVSPGPTDILWRAASGCLFGNFLPLDFGVRCEIQEKVGRDGIRRCGLLPPTFITV
jgi:hypothetical protein